MNPVPTPEYGVRSRLWRNGELAATDFPLEEISDYLNQPDCLIWVDVCAPDTARLQALADELSLDPNAVEDAVAERERPKASHYRSHIFLTAYALNFDSTTHAVTGKQISAFAMPHALITVRGDASFDIDAVLTRWDDNSELIRYGAKTLVHGLLDVIVDTHFTVMESLDDQIEQLEDDLFAQTGADNAVQRHSFTLRKSLVRARRAILPMRELVNELRRYDHGQPHSHVEALEPYFNDLYDHVLRATEWSESIRDLLSSVFETNLSLADMRMNTIMKKLTAWAAIIAVPTAITGFYGQNVPYPGFGHVWGFWISTAAILLIAAALWVSFRRRDWL